jgi:hypothetical protein
VALQELGLAYFSGSGSMMLPLCHMPNLRRLTLKHCSFTQGEWEHLGSVLSCLHHSLSELDVEHVGVTNPLPQLYRGVEALARLRRLHLRVQSTALENRWAPADPLPSLTQVR